MPDKASSRLWAPLFFLNLYRIVLPGFLLALLFSGRSPSFLGAFDPHLYLMVNIVYLAFGLASAYTIRRGSPAFITQVYLQLAVDIVALTVLMHTSGGVSSGVGLLLLVSIAGGSLLMEGRISLLFAALAALAVLGEQVYAASMDSFATTYYTQAGMLGAALMATALVVHLLAQRARHSEALATQRGVDLANMAQLTDYVIDRMQTGAVVMDGEQRVWMMNAAARRLLGVEEASMAGRLDQLSPELARHWQHWRESPDYEADAFQAPFGGMLILPRFARLGEGLGEGQGGGTLIFLQDLTALSQQAQQLKLASLGRLTASIAHEVRNPLGAISHAAQLLAESSQLDPEDARLTQIIYGQCQRVNDIIENVLQLSRRESSHIQDFALREWLRGFVDDFVYGDSEARIDIDVQPADLRVRMDPLHLRQILYNLCQNGLRYSKAHTGQPIVLLRGRMMESTPVLDVIDRGAGIAPETAQQIFEPFFTTEAHGTGLGLYIARELCECNQARLSYLPAPEGGSCFRISFADLRRRIA